MSTETPTPTPEVAPELPPVAENAPTLASALYPEETTSGAGEETTAAAESEPGADSVPGEDSTPGSDSISGSDSLTADSYTFTLPDNIQVNDALLGEAKSFFAAAGIAPETATSLVQTLVPKLLEGQVQALANAQQEQFNQLQATWVGEINAMPEFKGEARKASEAAIASALDAFGPTVQREAADGTKKTVNLAREAMDITGAGNNPAIVQLVLSMAKALSEGSPTGLGRPAGRQAPRTLGGVLYPTPS